jgi:hypothetical protein
VWGSLDAHPIAILVASSIYSSVSSWDVLHHGASIKYAVTYAHDNGYDVFTAGVIRQFSFYNKAILIPFWRATCFKIPAGTLAIATQIGPFKLKNIDQIFLCAISAINMVATLVACPFNAHSLRALIF